MWLDNRTHAIVDELLQRDTFQAEGKDTLRPICGLPLSTYFSATKLVWLIKNVPAVQKAIKEDRCIFGTVDTWLIWVTKSKHKQTNLFSFILLFVFLLLRRSYGIPIHTCECRNCRI